MRDSPFPFLKFCHVYGRKFTVKFARLWRKMSSFPPSLPGGPLSLRKKGKKVEEGKNFPILLLGFFLEVHTLSTPLPSKQAGSGGEEDNAVLLRRG